jgi:hypothetical protein
MSGDSDLPPPPGNATPSPKGFWDEHGGKVILGVVMLLVGTGYQVFGWGLEGWIDKKIREHVQIQEMLKLGRENAKKADDLEKLMLQLDNRVKTQNEFLLRVLAPDHGSPPGR